MLRGGSRSRRGRNNGLPAYAEKAVLRCHYEEISLTSDFPASFAREISGLLYPQLCEVTGLRPQWGMLTGILQNEWGFTGYAVSDIGDDKDLYTGMVYAGLTGYDMRSGYPTSTEDFASKIGNQANIDGERIQLTLDMFAKDLTMQQTIRNNIMRVLWSFAHSNLMNRYNASTHKEWQMTPWRAMYIGGIAVTGVLALASCAMFFISGKKSKKEEA